MTETKNALIDTDESLKPNDIILENHEITSDLEKHILQDWRKSGISDKTILEYAKSGYLVGMPDGWKLFYPDLHENNLTEYYNWRHFNIENGQSKYSKPTNMSSRLFRPLALSFEIILDKTPYIIITEGEKKAIKAVDEGFNCVALSGVYGWKQKPKNDKPIETNENNFEEDIIADIKNIDLRGKVIYLCYDNDLWVKQQVREALYHFAAYLIGEKGAIVKIINLPKEDEKCGLDDYLVKYGRDEFQKLVDKAKTITLKEIQNILSGNNVIKNEFPLNVFSEPIQNIISELQSRLDAPIEYIASTVLLAASMIMDGRFALTVNPASNWIEHAIIWLALVGTPSQKKTPCINIGKNIIDKYNVELAEKYERELEEYKEAYNQYKAELETYKAAIKSGRDMTQPKEPKVPLKARISTQNVTVEALCHSINCNSDENRGVGIFVDELSHFLKGLNQYKKGGNDLEYILQSWSKSWQNILRQGGNIDYTIQVSHNICGTIQPKVLSETLFSSGVDTYNGMVERWLFSGTEYEETGILATYDNDYDLSELTKRYDRLFNSDKELKMYYLSDTAQNVFKQFYKTVADMKKSSKMSDLAKNYLQKQTNYVARFALILHCLETPESTTISEISVINAIKLSKYFFVCFNKITQERISANPLTEATLNYLRTKNKKSISPTALRKSNTSRYKTPEMARIALENLASGGYGRLCKTENGGCVFKLYE